ncbi:PREDICTED: phospholipase A1-Igamma1, chloroplastic-like [Ipomoea nil]|uniref:phospholipase A1-Igamma1, chloroplastic-like n=1 Tax=Ipomoea nil TaxID=35883 RepID=UPI000900C3F6|nr:PREDICTED: phospholipase A1-Igamma1, chloroplastic-like [Ipomoea nil]
MQSSNHRLATPTLRRSSITDAVTRRLPAAAANANNPNDAIGSLASNASTGAAKLAETMSGFLSGLQIKIPPRRRRRRNGFDSFNKFDDNNAGGVIRSFADMAAAADTPAMSPKENISSKWRELQGCRDWEGLLDPLHPWLRREIIKYGEFAQATYDALDLDQYSEYYGSCLYSRHKLLDKLGLTRSGYEVVSYIYAMSSHIDYMPPEWLLEGSSSSYVRAWSKDSNWIGFIAVSNDEETRRIGRRDIVVSWRGTVTPSEWSENLQNKLEPIGLGDAKVERGFLSIYTSKRDSTRYNKHSASEQAMLVLHKLVDYFYRTKGELLSLTITGHSLGGALAVLNAYESAVHFPTIPVAVISFAAPRVGNIAFRDEVYQKGVKTLRVTVKQDLITRWPGIVFNEGLHKYGDFTGPLEWVYTHIGAELKLDVRASPYLKGGINLFGCHMLETYLHLVDCFCSSSVRFREDAKRDVALVNKDCDMLVDELRIPPNWYQLENKGLECNGYGRWVRPKRELDDIPSPSSELFSFARDDEDVEQ